jgi:hypothetical protein
MNALSKSPGGFLASGKSLLKDKVFMITAGTALSTLLLYGIYKKFISKQRVSKDTPPPLLEG